MNACPPLVCESLPATDMQSEEFYTVFPQFHQDISFAHADMILINAENPPEVRKHVSWGKSSKRVDKKCLHRVIERERRKYMKSRYSELRSLLPKENIKGKASISDQLSEASGYIRGLQEKVEQLEKKRDEMNNAVQSYEGTKVYNSVSSYESEAFPLVNVNNVGSGVIVTTNTLREQPVLSKLLLAIEEEGLQVLTASTFGIHDKVFHTIQCKVTDSQSFKCSSKLYQKLAQVIGRSYIQDEAGVPHVQGQGNAISMPCMSFYTCLLN